MDIYKKSFRYVPEYRVFGYLAVLISAISAFIMVLGYHYIYKFFDEVIVKDNLENASVYAIKIVIYLTLAAILYLISGLASHKLAFRLETNLRKRGIDGLTDSSFRFFDINPSGQIRKTIDDNAAMTHTAVAHMIPDNSQAFLTPILAIVLAFSVSIRVGIIIVILTLVSALILKAMMGNSEFMKVYQAALDKLSSETVEYIRGMQVVKIFGTKLNSFKALDESIKNYSKYAYDYSLSCKKPYVIYQLIFLGLIAIISIPLSFFITGMGSPKNFTVELIMIFFISGVIMVSFMKIMWASMNIFNAKYAIDNLEALYDKMQEDRLTFSYGENTVIENLSFSLLEKRTYALVGHSGSGKSTIAKLLSGFYRLDAGTIKIGGYPLEEYTKEAIIRNISFVFQDSKLFKKSIFDNVAIADESANREDVMKALSLAGCDEILAKFKDKENTIIGSKGVYLSGGEKQRIAIARAILKNSPIVIMDEASASIDADNEYELQKAFKNLMKDRTVIMIAHRLSSIQNVDEIIVLEGGKVVERGSNDSLIEKQGIYSRLLRLYETANDWRV